MVTIFAALIGIFSTQFLTHNLYAQSMGSSIECSVTPEYQELKNSAKIEGFISGDEPDDIHGELTLELKRPGHAPIHIVLNSLTAHLRNNGGLSSIEIAKPSSEVDYVRVSRDLPIGNSFVLLNKTATSLPETYRGGKFYSDCGTVAKVTSTSLVSQFPRSTVP